MIDRADLCPVYSSIRNQINVLIDIGAVDAGCQIVSITIRQSPSFHNPYSSLPENFATDRSKSLRKNKIQEMAARERKELMLTRLYALCDLCVLLRLIIVESIKATPLAPMH